MLRNFFVLAIVLAMCTSAFGVVVNNVDLSFVTPNSTYNTLNLHLYANYSLLSDDDTSSTTVTSGSNALLKLNYDFDPATHDVTSVNGIEFTGGNFGLANTHFDLSFIFSVDVDATGITGTFDTPSPPGSISGESSATFATEQHNVIISQGTINVTSSVYNDVFSISNVATTTVGSATLNTTKVSASNGLATYNVEMILPVDFDEDLETGSTTFTASLTGTGTFKATGSFTVEYDLYDPIAVADETYTTPMNTPLNVSELLGVLNNDYDPDGGDVDVYYVHPTSTGTVDMDMETGAFTFTPRTDFVGDTWFWYRAVDDEGALSEYSIARISVTGPGESSQVPEPGTLALLAGALVGFALRRRSK